MTPEARRLPSAIPEAATTSVVVVPLSLGQWCRRTDFDRRQHLTGGWVCEAQDAPSFPRCSSQIANVEIVVDVKSHARRHVQSAHDFLGGAVCDPDNPALTDVWKTCRTGEFHNVQPSLAILLYVSNGCKPSPVIDHETFFRYLIQLRRSHLNGKQPEIANKETAIQTGDRRRHDVSERRRHIGELFNSRLLPPTQIDS